MLMCRHRGPSCYFTCHKQWSCFVKISSHNVGNEMMVGYIVILYNLSHFRAALNNLHSTNSYILSLSVFMFALVFA